MFRPHGPTSARLSRHFFELNDARNGARESAPASCFFLKLSTAGSCERIIFRAPSILGRLPLGSDPTFLLELMQSRVKRTVADLKNVTRHLLQSLADGKAVHWFER